MSFLNISLLAGSLFVAVPILLHLLMRRRPQHVIFPALQFVKRLRQTNQQRLRLKNWLLLLLRCAIVVALAVAVARPTIASGLRGAYVLYLLGDIVGAPFNDGAAEAERLARRAGDNYEGFDPYRRWLIAVWAGRYGDTERLREVAEWQRAAALAGTVHDWDVSAWSSSGRPSSTARSTTTSQRTRLKHT